jgi:hypothetical protein
VRSISRIATASLDPPNHQNGETMIFSNSFHDGFGTWPVAYIPYGGADFGEIVAVAEAIGQGDDGAYYSAWMQAGDRISAERRPLWRRAIIAALASCF